MARNGGGATKWGKPMTRRTVNNQKKKEMIMLNTDSTVKDNSIGHGGFVDDPVEEVLKSQKAGYNVSIVQNPTTSARG